jgi:hypothetical protein
VDDLAEIAPSHDEITLGKRMYSQAFTLRGRLSDGDWRLFLVACAEAMDMSPAGNPAVWSYPVEGKGGFGKTILQPITESFLVADTWPDHDGAYLFICSCRKFDATQLIAPIKRFSLGLDDMSGTTTLRL